MFMSLFFLPKVAMVWKDLERTIIFEHAFLLRGNCICNMRVWQSFSHPSKSQWFLTRFAHSPISNNFPFAPAMKCVIYYFDNLFIQNWTYFYVRKNVNEWPWYLGYIWCMFLDACIFVTMSGIVILPCLRSNQSIFLTFLNGFFRDPFWFLGCIANLRPSQSYSK